MSSTTKKPAPSTVYNIAAAAERVNLKQGTFRALVKSGRIPQPIRISPRRPVWTEAVLADLILSL
jgi:predicted DNA-binding transcriptional regulator AlpA